MWKKLLDAANFKKRFTVSVKEIQKILGHVTLPNSFPVIKKSTKYHWLKSSYIALVSDISASNSEQIVSQVTISSSWTASGSIFQSTSEEAVLLEEAAQLEEAV